MILRRDCQIGGFRYHFYLGLLVRAVGKFYHVLRCVISIRRVMDRFVMGW